MISVVVPTYNEERYVGGLLTQLQPFVGENLEVIVSDNQSTDNTIAIVKEFGVRIVSADQHLTIGEVRNVGAAATTGEIICFFDADTTMADPQEFIRRIHVYHNATLTAVIGPVRVTPREQRTSDRWNMGLRTQLIHWSNILGFGAGSGEFFALTRDLWLKSGGFKANVAAGEDNELFQRLRRLGSVTFDRRLRTHTSPRRIRRDGWPRLWYAWSRNFFSSLVFGKSADKKWNAPR